MDGKPGQERESNATVFVLTPQEEEGGNKKRQGDYSPVTQGQVTSTIRKMHVQLARIADYVVDVEVHGVMRD